MKRRINVIESTPLLIERQRLQPCVSGSFRQGTKLMSQSQKRLRGRPGDDYRRPSSRRRPPQLPLRSCASAKNRSFHEPPLVDRHHAGALWRRCRAGGTLAGRLTGGLPGTVTRPLKPRIDVKTLLIRHKTAPHSRIMNQFVARLGKVIAAEQTQ